MALYTCDRCGETFVLEVPVHGLGGTPREILCHGCEAERQEARPW